MTTLYENCGQILKDAYMDVTFNQYHTMRQTLPPSNFLIQVIEHYHPTFAERYEKLKTLK